MGASASYRPSRLKGIVFETTLACNLRCLHCGSAASQDTARQEELSLAESFKLVADVAALGADFVTLSGGEPLLCGHWEELARAIAEHGMEPRIITNGSRIDAALADRLAALPRPPAVAISLDGGRPETHDAIRGCPGLHAQILDAIGLLRERGVPAAVVTCVHKGNLDELPLLRDILARLDIYAWQIQPAAPSGRMSARRDLVLDSEDRSRLARIIRDFRAAPGLAVLTGDSLGYYSDLENDLRDGIWTGCKAGLDYLGIRSNGDVTGCLSMQRLLAEGNIRTRPLRDIWSDPQLFAYNRQFDPEALTGNCSRCDLKAICKGGCRFMAEALSGGFLENPSCLRLTEGESRQHFLIG